MTDSCKCGHHQALAAKDAEIKFWKDRTAEHAQMYLDVEAKLERAEGALLRISLRGQRSPTPTSSPSGGSDE